MLQGTGWQNPERRMPLNKEFEGLPLLFKRHCREWQVTLGLMILHIIEQGQRRLLSEK